MDREKYVALVESEIKRLQSLPVSNWDDTYSAVLGGRISGLYMALGLIERSEGKKE
jgi:hypothetical protein